MSNDDYQQRQFWEHPIKLGQGIYTQMEMDEFKRIDFLTMKEWEEQWDKCKKQQSSNK